MASLIAMTATNAACQSPDAIGTAGGASGHEAGVATADAGGSAREEEPSGEAPTPSTSDDASASGPDAAVDSPEGVLTGASEGGSEIGNVSGGAGDAGEVPRGPTWANWPMPNPASSGLPNPASYDTSVAGVVLDRVTGLMWQRSDIAGAGYATAADAQAYCTDLSLGGFHDWRLPSRIEMWSIQDFATFAPALDPAFSTLGTEDMRVAPWTSTPGNGTYAIGPMVDTSQGNQSVESTAGFEQQGGGSVRCVRGSVAQPVPHYTIKNGTVFDNGTKLTWLQGYDPVVSLPNGVANYCASLTLDGGGWRGPSVKELESIVDDTRVVPSIDTSAFQVPSGTSTADTLSFYATSAWAGTPASQETWEVDFDDGSNSTGDSSISVLPYPSNNNFLQVRCVK